jgi:hypothetical protein
MNLPLNCFKCGRKLTPAFEDADSLVHVPNQPRGGTTFITHGHYGSTVFDPVSDINTLTINICDPCMIEFRNRIALRRIIQREPTITFHSWDPYKD